MVDRLEMARKALETAEKQTANWPGPCHECRYWRSLHHGSSISNDKVTEWDTCANELALLETFTPHTGYSGDRPKVSRVRNDYGLCGPEGKLFQAHETSPLKRGFWSKLFG